MIYESYFYGGVLGFDIYLRQKSWKQIRSTLIYPPREYQHKLSKHHGKKIKVIITV